MYFFAFNLEKYTPDRIFYTGSARGARDNYEVCDRLEVVPVTMESGSKQMGSPFRVEPASDEHKVRDKALNVAAEDDVVALDH